MVDGAILKSKKTEPEGFHYKVKKYELWSFSKSLAKIFNSAMEFLSIPNFSPKNRCQVVFLVDIVVIATYVR